MHSAASGLNGHRFICFLNPEEMVYRQHSNVTRDPAPFHLSFCLSQWVESRADLLVISRWLLHYQMSCSFLGRNMRGEALGKLPVLEDQKLSYNCRGSGELTAGSWLSACWNIRFCCKEEDTSRACLTGPLHLLPENNMCMLALVPWVGEK